MGLCLGAYIHIYIYIHIRVFNIYMLIYIYMYTYVLIYTCIHVYYIHWPSKAYFITMVFISTAMLVFAEMVFVHLRSFTVHACMHRGSDSLEVTMDDLS